MPFVLLHNPRVINIATVILLTISGLYGFQGLLGRPGGLLRQLLVGIPAGIILGISYYLFDVATNNLLSNTFREIIQSPAIPVSSITVGVIGFIVGLTWPLLAPDLYRKEPERQGVSTPIVFLLLLYMVVSGTFLISIAIQAMFQLFGSWLKVHPPFLGVIIAAFILATVWVYMGATNYHVSFQFGYQDPSNNTTPTTPQSPLQCLGCIFILIFFIITISFLVYFVSLLGWRYFFYYLILTGGSSIIIPIQNVADHLKKQHLQVIALVLFVLAAALQLYQAIEL